MKVFAGEGEGEFLSTRNQNGDRLEIDTAFFFKAQTILTNDEIAKDFIQTRGVAGEDFALNELRLLTLIRRLAFDEDLGGMHADSAQFISSTSRQADGTTGRIRQGGAIIGLARIADVVIGDVGSIYGLSTTTAGGYNKETEG